MDIAKSKLDYFHDESNLDICHIYSYQLCHKICQYYYINTFLPRFKYIGLLFFSIVAGRNKKDIYLVPTQKAHKIAEVINLQIADNAKIYSI